jgi:hypothetical protein
MKRNPELILARLDELRDASSHVVSQEDLDLIETLTEETIEQFCLGAEDYERSKYNQRLVKGLHGYLYRLPRNTKIIKLKEFMYKNPELNISKLDKLISNFKPFDTLAFINSCFGDELTSITLEMEKFDI